MCSTARARLADLSTCIGFPPPRYLSSAMARISSRGGRVSADEEVREARLRWKGLGLVTPANMPMYWEEGVRVPRTREARP